MWGNAWLFVATAMANVARSYQPVRMQRKNAAKETGEDPGPFLTYRERRERRKLGEQHKLENTEVVAKKSAEPVSESTDSKK